MSMVKSPGSGFDPRAYRNALGCFGTGVCVITTQDGNITRGITINSFASVSLSPSIILWSIDVSSDRCQLFSETDTFAVSFLKAEHQDIANDCTSSSRSVLTADKIDFSSSRIPFLKGALGHLICETSWRQKAGDHIVIFGNVVEFASCDGDALGYFRGGYTPIAKQEG